MERGSVWDTAEQMIRLYGENAAAKARMRADELFAEHDIKGFHAWTHIATAVDDLNRPPPRSASPMA